jgi:hypothetical protein
MTKLLNALLFAIYMVGHAVAGVFFNNTRVIGIPETENKRLILLGHLAAWPMLGLAVAFPPSRFLRSLTRPFSYRGLWQWTFTLVGLRWMAQETYRKLHPRPQPVEVLSSTVEDADMRNHIIEFDQMEKEGVRGLVNKANQLYALEVVTHEIALPALPPSFDGFTILHVSDIHYAPYLSREFLRCLVEMCLDISPNVIAITGDFQTYPEVIESTAELLSPLGEWSETRRGGLGVASVLGNHDREAGVAHVTDALRRAGIKVLHNSHMRIERDGSSLYVVGVADPWSWRADLDMALHGVPEGSCTVLLAHVPDFLITAAKRGISLQLSGHNHGGQIKLPLLGPVLVSSRYSRRYAESFHKQGDTLMYVSRGIGGKPPIRLGCKPEITRLVLRGSVD